MDTRVQVRVACMTPVFAHVCACVRDRVLAVALPQGVGAQCTGVGCGGGGLTAGAGALLPSAHSCRRTNAGVLVRPSSTSPSPPWLARCTITAAMSPLITSTEEGVG